MMRFTKLFGLFLLFLLPSCTRRDETAPAPPEQFPSENRQQSNVRTPSLPSPHSNPAGEVPQQFNGLLVELGLDPTVPQPEAQARQAAIATQFLTPQDRFILRATDQKTTIISTAVPESDTDAYAVFQSIIKQIVPITDLATYFETVAVAAEESDRPVVCLLYTDGLCDGDRLTTTKRIEAAATRLAKNSNVRAVALIGLVRETRPGWIGLPEMLSCLNEGSKKRLYIQPQAAMHPDQIADLLDDVRTQSAMTAENR